MTILFRLNTAYQGVLPATLYVGGHEFTSDDNGVFQIPIRLAKVVGSMQEYSPVMKRKSKLSVTDSATATVTRKST